MRFTFVILLFCCLGADAQMIIKAHANYIPLSTETGINAIFSIRKIVSGYSGSAIRVRRSNDNTEQDIGWVGTELDTASLKTFVGANSGFVTTWYNQNGGNNATQTTAANQPRIVNAGTVERLSGKVTLFFDGTNDNMYVSSFNNTKVSAFVVFARQTGTSLGRAILRKGRTSNTSLEFILRTDASNYLEGAASTGASTVLASTSPNTINATAINLGVFLFNNSTVRTSINSNAYVSNNLSGNMFQGTANMVIGSTCSNETCTAFEGYWGGRISEVLIYGTTVNDVTIKNNINSYYNLFWDGTFASILDTFPSSAAAYSLRNLSSTYKGALIRVRRSNDNAEQDIFGDYYGNLDTAGLKEFVGANSGFVTTWYDQSGNARNATQTTAANQPRVVNAGIVERSNGKPSIRFISHLMSVNYTNFHLIDTLRTFNIVTPVLAAAANVTTEILWGYDGGGGSSTAGSRGISWGAATVLINNEKFGMYFSNSTSGGGGRLGQTNYTRNANTMVLHETINRNGTPGTLWYLNNDNTNRSFNLSANMNTNTNTAPSNTETTSTNFWIKSTQGNINAVELTYSELIIYTSLINSRSGIQTNINNYYSIW